MNLFIKWYKLILHLQMVLTRCVYVKIIIRLSSNKTVQIKLNLTCHVKEPERFMKSIIMSIYTNGTSESENEWERLCPLINEEANNGKTGAAIFKLFSQGFETYREEGMYDLPDAFQRSEIFIKKGSNIYLIINSPSSSQDFSCLSTDIICDLNFSGNSQYIPLYWYSNEGTRQDNITNWALQLFNDYYRLNEPSSPVCYAGSAELRDEFRLDITGAAPITKEAIFYYVYAVLHHPAYREKYRMNLQREFPRIPLYDNFQQWAAWGKRLMNLHINYETVTPYPLERRDVMIEQKAGVSLDSLHEAKLKAYKEEGVVEIDAITTLTGIPKTAWEYKLGNHSALEWILDQYKEEKPSDLTIVEQFNTHHFRDYKHQVIELLKRVCT
jgi:predicted helicase